jgi:undecaprenyl diphosphate synthase
MQSTLHVDPTLHAAIIMDGNGRWATRRGWPRTVGHRAGARAVRRIVEAAPTLGIQTLTLFAFSSDNWRRPPAEVAALMGLLGRYLDAQAPKLKARNVRLSVIGRRDRLATELADKIAAAEQFTRDGLALHLRIAIDYSSRAEMAKAAAAFSLGADVSAVQFPAVDLVIRTGGEKRLSDFLLWESAYAELIFSDLLWPDFGARDLRAAIAEFHTRQRRFGGLATRAEAPDAALMPA